MQAMVVRHSSADYESTTRMLLEGVERRGLTLFARIDHAGAAREVGLELADEEVFLFGNPRAGTPLMQSDRRLGIELPLRVLVWSENGQVLLGYRDPRELAGEYDLAEHQAILGQMASLLADIVDEAAS